MSIPGLIIAALLLTILLFLIGWPLRSTKMIRGQSMDRQRERALAYYERVLTNIRDLDEDRSTGKIAEEEYQTEREFWADRGVRLLKLIDHLDEQNPILASMANDDAAIDAAIEEAIAAAQKQQVER